MTTKMRKYLRQTFFLMLIFNALLFSQWSNDPNNNLIVGYGLDPNICSDSAGGCYITYDYDNLSYPRKLALERIDRYGNKPWGTKKQILGEFPQQHMAEIVEDGEGGVIVSYQDWLINSPYYTSRVRIQRVDSLGNFLWAPIGIRATIDEINQGSQKLVSDGNGGCIIIWQDSLSQYNINRINRLGERIWGDSGFVLGTGQYSKIVNASDGCYYVQIGTVLNRLSPSGQIIWQESISLGEPIADNKGGVVLSERVWTGMIPKLVAQRKDSLGNNLWQDPYVEIADSLGLGSYRCDRNDKVIYFAWLGSYNGQISRPYFQAINLEGNLLFQDKVLLSQDSSGTTLIGIIPSYENKTIFSWNISDPTNSLFAQMYDTLSNKIWAETGVSVAQPSINNQQYTTDGQGGFIVSGAINEFTIVVQQVSRDGNLGEVLPVPVELVTFTGTVSDNKVTLNWITSTELNNYGFEIERLKDFKIEKSNEWERIGFVEGHGTTTETHSYSFIDSDVLSGKVKYRLKQIDFDGTFAYSNEIEVDVDITQKEFVLHQNYPNPFNPATVIRYELPQDGLVTIKVFDILGKEVTTLVNENKSAGRYTVNFDGSNFASGVYLYQLKSGDFISTKKMMLVK